MFTFPLYILLIIFLFAIGVFFVMYTIILYHIIVNASLTKTSTSVAILLALCAFFSIFFTFYLLRNVDWQHKVTLPDDIWSNDNSFFEGNNTL